MHVISYDAKASVQRDVYSAFLALPAVRGTIDGVEAWAHDRDALEAAWVVLAKALLAEGLFKPKDDKDTADIECIPSQRRPCETSSGDTHPAGVTGRLACRAARVETILYVPV